LRSDFGANWNDRWIQLHVVGPLVDRIIDCGPKRTK
jgi:hypothetical protein